MKTKVKGILIAFITSVSGYLMFDHNVTLGIILSIIGLFIWLVAFRIDR